MEEIKTIAKMTATVTATMTVTINVTMTAAATAWLEKSGKRHYCLRNICWSISVQELEDELYRVRAE